MTNDTATYRAVQAVAPGRLELTTKPLRDEPAVGQRSDPERHVDVIFGQAEDPIDQDEADIDVGIGLQELGQDRDEIYAPEVDGSRDDELAGRLRVFAGGGAVGF